MTTQTATDRLIRCIRASYPIIIIISHEEQRVLSALQIAATKTRRTAYTWSITEGIQPAWDAQANTGHLFENTQHPAGALAAISEYQDETPTLFVAKDLHVYVRDDAGEHPDPMILRHLRNIAAKFENCPHTLVLLSPQFIPPADLEKSVTIIDWPLPGQDELSAILEMAERDVPSHIPVELNGDRQVITRAMQGLTEFEARSALASAIIAAGRLDDSVVPHIVAEKRQIVRKSGLLEFFEADVSMAQVGGLPHLKRYSEVKRASFTDEARSFGVEPARGVLLLGLPGVGKSLTAKAIAGGKMPLLRMDVGALMGGILGQSESNTRAALKVAEAIAPAVVWLDEIEKALGGSGGEHDGGTSMRVMGSILTFMQESTAPIYWVATANDVRALRPELINRFDDVFFVDLPNHDDRVEILSIHLGKRGRNPDDFDLVAIADACHGLVGREIERLVKAALEAAFYAGEQLTTAHLLAAAGSIVPISATMAEQIDSLRSWAETRARRANDPIEPKPVSKAASKPRFSEL